MFLTSLDSKNKISGFTYIDVISGLTVILIILGAVFGSIRMMEKSTRQNALIPDMDSFANWIFEEINLRKFDENIESIEKIFLSDRKGTNLTLIKEENGWRINNSYKVRNDAITTLLNTISEIKIQRPVPNSSYNNVIKQLATTGVKVEIFYKNKVWKTPLLYIIQIIHHYCAHASPPIDNDEWITSSATRSTSPLLCLGLIFFSGNTMTP